MRIKHLLFYLIPCIYFAHAFSMEPLATTYELLSMPENILIHMIAHYHIKDDVRKICKHFRTFASSNNEKILASPSLELNQKTLEKLLLYYGYLGNNKVVDNLLSKGANPNACDDKGMTVMHYAAQYGYVDICDTLLKHPTLINTSIAQGDNCPFTVAIRYNQDSILKKLCWMCKISTVDVLYKAINEGSLLTAKTFLDNGINDSYIHKNGISHLGTAAIHGHTHILRLLIAHGAQVNGYISVGKNGDVTPLHCAALAGHTNATELLIEYGADVNAKGIVDNCTSLHFASFYGYVNVIDILLKNGACINEKDNNNKTALDWAKTDDVKQFLIAHGGKTNAQLTPTTAQLTQRNAEMDKDNCVMQ